MAPPPAGTATARKVSGLSSSGRVGTERQRSAAAAAAARRAELRPVPAVNPRRASLLHRIFRGRFLTMVSIAVFVGALLVVVVGQAMLANGQVRMAAIQHDLNLEQAVHRQNELSVSALETPARIVSAATKAGMVHPAQVTELPYVSLTTPLATPKVAAAPATATTTPTTAAPQ